MIRSHSLTRMRIEVASTKRAEWLPTTPAQREKLAQEMGEYGLAVWTAYWAGLRAGESLGLRKSDFVTMIGADGPFTALRLTRQRQVHAKTQMDDTAPLKARGEDDSERWVSVPPELAAMVESAQTYGDDESLFPPAFNSTLYARVRKAREVAGLPKTWSLHDLRHECASDLLAMGVSDTLVAQQIGHTSTMILPPCLCPSGDRWTSRSAQGP
jgi:integrase